MAHPMSKFRQANVERARVKGLTGSSGAEGDMARYRADRPMRAAGGKVSKKGTTVVNVIVSGQQKPQEPPMPMMAPPPPPPPPGPPPGAMAPPPGGPPPGLAGAGGPPMPMRAAGGKVTVPTPKPRPAGSEPQPADLYDRKDVERLQNQRAKGGGVKSKGMKVGTKVQHGPAHMEVGKLHRPRVVTFNTGGGVVSFRARGGRIEASDAVAPATKLPGGAGGGKGRLAKARAY